VDNQAALAFLDALINSEMHFETAARRRRHAQSSPSAPAADVDELITGADAQPAPKAVQFRHADVAVRIEADRAFRAEHRPIRAPPTAEGEPGAQTPRPIAPHLAYLLSSRLVRSVWYSTESTPFVKTSLSE
jgi:hypothetical protein